MGESNGKSNGKKAAGDGSSLAGASHHPWDRLDGEPIESYHRFLFYRNLGPSRSLERAHLVSLHPEHREARKGKKTLLPGNWSQESSRWRWRERARLYDVHHLVQHGDDVILIHIKVLRLLAASTLDAIESRAKCKPKSFGELIAAIDILGRFISNDAIQALYARAAETAGQFVAGANAGRPVLGDGRDAG